MHKRGHVEIFAVILMNIKLPPVLSKMQGKIVYSEIRKAVVSHKSCGVTVRILFDSTPNINGHTPASHSGSPQVQISS
jgi:hypothetical protein